MRRPGSAHAMVEANRLRGHAPRSRWAPKRHNIPKGSPSQAATACVMAQAAGRTASFQLRTSTTIQQYTSQQPPPCAAPPCPSPP